MFRPSFAQIRKSLDLLVSNSGYCTSRVNRTSMEINECKFVGTLIFDARVFESGTKSLILRTVNATDNHYQTHTVWTRANLESLKYGQRLYVSGHLVNQPFDLENGKRRDSTIIQAQRIIVLDHEDGVDNQTYDFNQVHLVGNVVKNVFSTGKVSIFNVATHHIDNRSEESKPIFHSVFVQDERLREYVKNLRARDQVVVEGELRHNTHTAADGKKKHSGFIAATNIGKIARLNKNVEEHHNIDRESNN